MQKGLNKNACCEQEKQCTHSPSDEVRSWIIHLATKCDIVQQRVLCILFECQPPFLQYVVPSKVNLKPAQICRNFPIISRKVLKLKLFGVQVSAGGLTTLIVQIHVSWESFCPGSTVLYDIESFSGGTKCHFFPYLYLCTIEDYCLTCP